jgi:hypothetical protein
VPLSSTNWEYDLIACPEKKIDAQRAHCSKREKLKKSTQKKESKGAIKEGKSQEDKPKKQTIMRKLSSAINIGLVIMLLLFSQIEMARMNPCSKSEQRRLVPGNS